MQATAKQRVCGQIFLNDPAQVCYRSRLSLLMNDPIAMVEHTAEAQARHLLDAYVVPNYGRLALVPERGRGAWLWDAGGKKYLDFGGGVAVTALGHCHEVLVRALTEQSEKLIHCSNWYQIPEQGRLAQFLTRKVVQTPGKCFFCNSGAEANEALVKLARKFGHATPQADGTPRLEILTFSNSFHGRTFAGISATAQQKVKDGFEPLLDGFTHLPFNDCAALEQAVSSRTVALLLEPVQGEGGIHIASPEFLRTCARLCLERNLLLLFDEVQCGLGRAGHWCGWKAVLGENTDVVPDGVSWAKGIAGGFPLGAAWIRRRPVSPEQPALPLCDVLGPGSHGSTYGGNPLGCVVALAVLQEIERAGLCAGSAEAGQRIAATVSGWKLPAIRDVRGRGLLLGFEFDAARVEAAADWTPGTTPSIYVVKKLMEAGLLTVAAGPGVVRWLPPLNVTAEEIAAALVILKQVASAL